jgi:Sybindin-like family
MQSASYNRTNLASAEFQWNRSTGDRVVPSAMFSNSHRCVPLPREGLTSGLKFLLLTEPRQPNVDTVLKRIYELYSDYVMKNPFYQLDMPIRCEEFDRHLGTYAKSIP